MEFVTFEIAKKLKEKGFNHKCLFVYNKEQIINPEVVKTFGELSDDGYYELTKEGGGKLDWSFVYIYKYQLIQYRDIIIPREMIKAPTISQVLKWLREEKKLYIAINVWGGTWGYDIIGLTGGRGLHWTAYREDIKSYEDAALDGIKYTLDNLI